jgi:hypothetical protein
MQTLNRKVGSTLFMAAILLAGCGKGGGTSSGIEGKWVATRASFSKGPFAGVSTDLPAGTALVSFSKGQQKGYYAGHHIDRTYRVEGNVVIQTDLAGTEIGRSKILSVSADKLQVEGENNEVLDYRRITDDEFDGYLRKLPSIAPVP